MDAVLMLTLTAAGVCGNDGVFRRLFEAEHEAAAAAAADGGRSNQAESHILTQLKMVCVCVWMKQHSAACPLTIRPHTLTHSLAPSHPHICVVLAMHMCLDRDAWQENQDLHAQLQRQREEVAEMNRLLDAANDARCRPHCTHTHTHTHTHMQQMERVLPPPPCACSFPPFPLFFTFDRFTHPSAPPPNRFPHSYTRAHTRFCSAQRRCAR